MITFERRPARHRRLRLRSAGFSGAAAAARAADRLLEGSALSFGFAGRGKAHRNSHQPRLRLRSVEAQRNFTSITGLPGFARYLKVSSRIACAWKSTQRNDYDIDRATAARRCPPRDRCVGRDNDCAIRKRKAP